MELSEIIGGTDAPVENASTVEKPAEPVEPVAQVETQPEPTTTVEQPAQPRNEQGRFVKADEEKPHAVPVQALLEERRKRQELEARLQQIQQPQVKDDDFWNSPANAARQLVTSETQAMQQEIANIKYNLAEDLTRSLHPDYDAVRDGFLAKVHSGDPWAVAVAQQMSLAPNPAKFVYDQSKRQAQLEQIGDLSSYEARIRAEERAKVLKELQKPTPVPDVPRSLNSEPSAVIPSTPTGFEPTPLENLLNTF